MSGVIKLQKGGKGVLKKLHVNFNVINKLDPFVTLFFLCRGFGTRWKIGVKGAKVGR